METIQLQIHWSTLTNTNMLYTQPRLFIVNKCPKANNCYIVMLKLSEISFTSITSVNSYCFTHALKSLQVHWHFYEVQDNMLDRVIYELLCPWQLAVFSEINFYLVKGDTNGPIQILDLLQYFLRSKQEAWSLLFL